MVALAPASIKVIKLYIAPQERKYSVCNIKYSAPQERKDYNILNINLSLHNTINQTNNHIILYTIF